MEVDINKIENRLLEEDDRIASYLKGQMSGEEDQAFLRELEEKPEMKERAIIMARLIKGSRNCARQGNHRRYTCFQQAKRGKSGKEHNL